MSGQGTADFLDRLRCALHEIPAACSMQVQVDEARGDPTFNRLGGIARVPWSLGGRPGKGDRIPLDPDRAMFKEESRGGDPTEKPPPIQPWSPA